MATDQRAQLLAGKAYALFVSELERHLSDAKKRFSDQQKLQAKDYAQVRSDFHTIKGGAGFFGLNNVAKAASKIEDILHSPIEQLASQVDQIRGQLKEIEELIKEIPQPNSELDKGQ